MPEEKLRSIVTGLLSLAALGPALFGLGKAITFFGKLSGLVTKLSINLVKLGANANAVRGLLGGPFLGVIAFAKLASNEVDNFFARIQNSNVYFRNLKKDIEDLNKRVADLRRERELLEKQELERPSTSKDDLEAYAGVSNLAEAQSDLVFWLDLRAQTEKEVQRLQSYGLDLAARKQEKEIARIQTYIDSLTKLIGIYGEEQKIKDGLAIADKQKNDRLREELDLQLRLDNLRAVAESEPIRIPMADIAFDGLERSVDGINYVTDGAAQLAAILADALGGPEIGNAILDIEEIDLPEEEFEYFDEEIVKMSDNLIKLREGFEGLKNFAYQFADTVGQSFLQMREEGVRFIDALKKNMLNALNALMAQVITLITLYAILAVLSGGSSMANGDSFGMGLREFTRSNPFGSFMAEGLGFTKMRTAGMAMGSEGETGGVKIMGAVSGNNLVLMNQTGPRAYDRTFG